jgi:ubiquinone/menaquinone biosynthesis C-methylase UbiE
LNLSEISFLERVVPGKVQSPLWQEHISRYTFTLNYVANKIVLDVACGTGYGTELASEKADIVVGVDISREALAYAVNHRKNSNSEFVLADAHSLPFRGDAFDVVVSLETIEHLTRYRKFLKEIQYILKTNGELIMSTPNRRILAAKQKKPINPFHIKEFTSDELLQLLKVFSTKIQSYGQCPFTLKDFLFQSIDKYLPLYSKKLFKRLRKTTIEDSSIQAERMKPINPAYQVRKIWDVYPIYSPRFFVSIVKNEK